MVSRSGYLCKIATGRGTLHRSKMSTPCAVSTDKGHHILSVNIMLIHSEINTQPLALRRQRIGLNRQAIVAIPHLVQGRVAPQSPCSATGGLQRRLIDPGDTPFCRAFF